MNNTTKQNEKKAIEQDAKTVQELHEAELELVAGAANARCFHWKNSSSSWGF